MTEMNKHYQNNAVESDQDKFRRFFQNRYQAETETAEEFMSELQRLALDGRMDLEMTPEKLEKVIRDRFIEGLKSQHVQDYIVSQIRNESSEISLPRLLEIVQTLEEEELVEQDDDDDEEEEEEQLEEDESFAGGDKNVQIKSEREDFSIRQQLFPITGENFEHKFASLSAKLRSQRTELCCNLCQFKCLSKVLMDSHNMTIHHQSSDSGHTKCDACGAVFLSKIGLETHQVMLHGKSKTEMINRRLEAHTSHLVGLERLYNDGSVDKDFIFYDDLIGNGADQDVFEMEDQKSRRFSCEICQYRTSTAAQLRKHHQFFHSDAEIKHQCQECLYRAVTEEALVRHIAQNHSKPLAQKMKCELCEFVTVKKTELTRHLQTSHRGHKVYMCETCGKKFQTDKTLEVHHRVVHLNQKPFSCKLCDYKAGQKASLIAHNHSVHEGNKPYVCESCGYKTTSQSTLNAHKRMVHEKQRPHVCDHCGRSFAARAGMENHIQLIHEKQTPFTCDRCGKKFKRRPDLNNHIRCIHENNYFVCTVCNNSFQTARNLERHISTVHEQMKPFECGTCGQAFARRERLKHHIERNHQLVGGMGVGQQQVSTSHPVPSTTPASVMSESHHSNMASPHVPASPHLVSSQDHFLHHGHLGQDQQQQLHDLHRQSLLHAAQHSQTHPMVLLVHQQQQQHQLQH